MVVFTPRRTYSSSERRMRLTASSQVRPRTVSFAYLSPGGIGVRIDGAVYRDYTIPPYYDALLAKLTDPAG